MSQFRSGLLGSICAAMLAAGCSSNNAVTDGGPDDAGPRDGGSGDAGPRDGGSACTPSGSASAVPGAAVLAYTADLTGVHLTWSLAGATGNERYEVLRSDEAAPFHELASATCLSAAAFNDLLASALPGVEHSYEVIAINSQGAGEPSNLVTVLQAPGDVIAGASDTRVLLTWSSIANVASYDVYRVPNADAGSGSATKLGNTLTAEYVDDGSISPITTGNSYSYQVVSLPLDGGLSSTGSNIVETQAIGLDVAANATYVSDLNATPTLPYNPSIQSGAFIFDGGSYTSYASFSTSDQTVISGVPAGKLYYLLPNPSASTLAFYGNTARALDLSYTAAGRSDVQAVTDVGSESAMSYALTNLTPWIATDAGPTDALMSVSLGADNFLSDVENDLDSSLTSGLSAIDAGATTFTGIESINGVYSDYHLVDSTQGDVYYLYQLHAQSSDAGNAYLAADKVYINDGIDMIDGGVTSISGGMDGGFPATSVSTMLLNGSAFAAQQSGVNPAATNANIEVSVLAEKDFQSYGWFTTSMPLFDATVANAGADIALGTVSWRDPFPASWDTIVNVIYGFNVDLAVPTASHAATFQALSQFYRPANGFDWSTGFAPTVQPVTDVKINGNDAFTDQHNTTVAPTISWSAPATGPTPNNYFVGIYQLAIDQNGTTTYSFLGNMFTSGTSVTLPGALLTQDTATKSYWFFVTIDAELLKNGSATVDQTTTPFQQAVTYDDVEVVTAKFSTGPGTAPPGREMGNALVRGTPASELPAASLARKQMQRPQPPQRQ